MPKINFEQEQVLASFVRQMVADKGLLEQDRQQQGKIQHEVRLELERAIDEAMIGALSDAQMLELEKRLDVGMTDDEIEQFLEGAGVDYDKVIGKAMAEFRKAYLGSGADMTNSNNGNLVQGTTSAAPGNSDVEGTTITMTETTEED